MSRDLATADSEFLVLVSDKASQFLYANPAYLRVSGYSWDDLKGTITARMLHKDMPMQVQMDMVATLRSRQPWSGIIKNQRKDGSTYWLRLNIAPLYSQGAFAGSLLVHRQASRSDIETHDAMYQRLRADKSLGYSHGRIVSNSFLARTLHRFLNRGLIARMWMNLALLNIATMLTLLAVIGNQPVVWTAWATMLVSSGIIGTRLSVSIVGPLRDAVKVANRMAAGDLGTEAHTTRTDEIGALVRALTQMNVNLRATVLDIRGGVGEMQTATDEISNGTHELSGRTEDQASHLEETSAAVSQINTTVQNTAEAARDASQFSKMASKAADHGGQIVGHVITTMDAITQSSKKIAEIIGVIDSIAFQTNILALNAAVEAARAGEHGRGFAVVAGEVRNLAQRTAHSAREIKALISTSVEQVAQGSSLVATAGQSIDAIVAEVRRVTDLVDRIAGETVGQSTGITGVTQAIAKLDHMTQQNASLAQDSTFSADTLRAHAEYLAQAVGVFRLSQQENQALFNATQISSDVGTERSIGIRAA